jgi:hypothetical protein
MRLAATLLRCLPVGLAIQTFGQASPPILIDTAPPPSEHFPANWYPPSNDESYPQSEPVHAPYTATLVITSHHRDPSTGEIKTISQRNRQARDKAGRKREEIGTGASDGGVGSEHNVTVSDPVSHCTFTWTDPWTGPDKPGATVTCLPLKLRYYTQNIWADAIVTTPREVHQLDSVYLSVPLGERSFGNIKAEGVRRTTTRTNVQTGETSQVVTEIWYSPELNEMIQVKSTVDPKRSQSVSMPDFELIDIQLADPAPELFYPPSGYRIDPTFPYRR